MKHNMHFLFDALLVNPDTNEKLILNDQKETIENIDFQKFNVQILDNVPVILPKKVQTELNTSDFHQKTNSRFEYLDHYQKDAEEFNYFFEYESAVTRNEMKRLHQTIIHNIPKKANLILDVGCGNAWLAKKLVSEKRKVISMDISTVNPVKALKNIEHENHFGLVADVFNLPLAENSVDAIVASEIIEHVANPGLFIEKLIKPLKKGGKLIITTPYNEKIGYHLCVHCNKPTPQNAHLHSFNEINIRQLIPISIHKWKSKIFIHSPLTKLRFHLLFGFLPFSIWNIVDAFSIKILKKASRFMIEIEK